MTERPSEAAIAVDVRYYAVTELSDEELDATYAAALDKQAEIPAILTRLEGCRAEYAKRGRSLPNSADRNGQNAAMNPTREEGDANDPREHDPTGPDVERVAVGPHNPAAGGSCDDCGRRYGNEYGFPDLTVSNEAWKQIFATGDDGGLLCPSCMIARAAASGLENVRATFVSGPFSMPHDPDSTAVLEHAADTLRGFNRDDPQRVAGTLLRLRDELTDRFNHLEQAAIERFIAGLTDAQIDAIDDFATEGANTAPDGTQLDGFDMDRWREGFREGLRRVAEEADKA